MPDEVEWWASYLQVFALNSPFGLPVKFTIGVSRFHGERLARSRRQEPRDVVDAYGRPCKQIDINAGVAIEWLATEGVGDRTKGGPPSDWGGARAHVSKK
jgi:hypothetical protein